MKGVAPTLSYVQLKALNPCEKSLRRVTRLMGGARKWDGTGITAEQARAAGATFDDIMWVASAKARSDADLGRRLSLWMADCATHVLHFFEKKHPADMRPRKAIIASRAFARGEIDAAALAAARDDAWAATAAATAAALAAATAAAWDDAWAARAAALAAATAAEEQWQFDRLIAWLSADEPEDWPLPPITKPEAA